MRCPVAMRLDPVVPSHPSVCTTLPGSTTSSMNVWRLSAAGDCGRFAAFVFNGDDNQHFLHGPASGRAFPERPDECLVDFDLARQRFPARPDHRAPEFVQPRPSRLIAAQPEELLQGERTGPGLRSGHGPHRPNQTNSRCVHILEGRAGRNRGLSAAGPALQQQGAHRPRLRMPTQRTAGALGPQLPRICATGLLGPELRLAFCLISRVLQHEPEHYLLGSSESNG